MSKKVLDKLERNWKAYSEVTYFDLNKVTPIFRGQDVKIDVEMEFELDSDPEAVYTDKSVISGARDIVNDVFEDVEGVLVDADVDFRGDIAYVVAEVGIPAYNPYILNDYAKLEKLQDLAWGGQVNQVNVLMDSFLERVCNSPLTVPQGFDVDNLPNAQVFSVSYSAKITGERVIKDTMYPNPKDMAKIADGILNILPNEYMDVWPGSWDKISMKSYTRGESVTVLFEFFGNLDEFTEFEREIQDDYEEWVDIVDMVESFGELDDFDDSDIDYGRSGQPLSPRGVDLGSYEYGGYGHVTNRDIRQGILNEYGYGHIGINNTDELVPSCELEITVTGCVVRPSGVKSIQDLLQGLVIFDWSETLDMFGC